MRRRAVIDLSLLYHSPPQKKTALFPFPHPRHTLAWAAAAPPDELVRRRNTLCIPKKRRRRHRPAPYPRPPAAATEALQQGTLFPGLDLPFHRELKSRFPAANTALSELMALDFAIDELGLYLTTHADDEEALQLYWDYIRLGREGRAKYEQTHGPLSQTTITEGGYTWLNNPWPWDEGGSD